MGLWPIIVRERDERLNSSILILADFLSAKSRKGPRAGQWAECGVVRSAQSGYAGWPRAWWK